MKLTSERQDVADASELLELSMNDGWGDGLPLAADRGTRRGDDRGRWLS